MKAHVVYDSYFGNTKIVAETIVSELKKSHAEVMLIHVDDFLPHDIDREDLLITCSPTRAFQATPKMMKKLKKLPRGLSLSVATADTRMDTEELGSKILSFLAKQFGYASDSMTKVLRLKGATLCGEEGFYVQDSEGPLKDGELERVRSWVGEVVLKLN